MSNVAKVLTDFRLLAGWVDTDQLSDANWIVLANKIYREVINTIKSKVKEDFFYDYWTADTVVWQEEYRLPIRIDWTQAWCTKLKWVSAKLLDADTKKTKFRPDTESNLPMDLNYYIANQSTADPFYIVSDMSVFIYPAPTEVITDWITLYWIADPQDLVSAWAESTILIPLEFHDILALWMIYLYYKTRLLTGEKNDAYNEYQAYLNKMISELSDRIEVPWISIMPDLTYLQ